MTLFINVSLIKPDVLYLPTQEMIDENNRLIFKKYKTIFVIKFLGFKCTVYSHRILDMQCNVPGSFHDATTWRLSVMKPYLEALDPKAVVLGDSAFLQSDTMITPYARNDARGNHNRALFIIQLEVQH